MTDVRSPLESVNATIRGDARDAVDVEVRRRRRPATMMTRDGGCMRDRVHVGNEGRVRRARAMRGA